MKSLLATALLLGTIADKRNGGHGAQAVTIQAKTAEGVD